MLKRYFQTFDNEGRVMFITGCFTFILTCLLTYILFRWVHPLLAGVVLILGLDFSSKLFNYATLGSIYRQKDGSNKDIYLSNKDHLDKRFKGLFGDDTTNKD